MEAFLNQAAHEESGPTFFRNLRRHDQGQRLPMQPYIWTGRYTAIQFTVNVLPVRIAENREVSMHHDVLDGEERSEVTTETNVETNSNTASVETSVVRGLTDSLDNHHSLVSTVHPFTKTKTGTGNENVKFNRNLEVPIRHEQSIDLGRGINHGIRSSCRRMKNYGEYYVNRKMRLKTFKTSAEKIAELCKRLQRKTKCKIYFSAQTTSSGIKHGHSFGKRLPDRKTEGKASSNEMPTLPTRQAQKLPGYPVNLPFIPPTSPPLQPKLYSVDSTEPCSHCKKQGVIGRDLKIIETPWVQCHGGDQPCSVRVHLDCLGFPGAKKLPPYYCPTHIIYGRKNEKVTSYYP